MTVEAYISPTTQLKISTLHCIAWFFLLFFFQSQNMAMVSLRFCFCLLLILLSFTSSETRALDQLASKRKQALIESAQEILKVNLRRQEMEIQGRYKVNRVSPGGPDPKHH